MRIRRLVAVLSAAMALLSAPVSGATFVTIDSEPGDRLGSGVDFMLTPADANVSQDNAADWKNDEPVGARDCYWSAAGCRPRVPCPFL